MPESPRGTSGKQTPQRLSHGDRFTIRSQVFDFVGNRNVHRPTNFIESTGHLIKGCLGGGILGAHEAYMKNGLWLSVIFTIIFGIYITYCVYILVYSAQSLYAKLHITDMSYPDVAEASFEVSGSPRLKKYSRAFRYAVDITICIDLFGACCVYQIIIAKTLMQLIEGTEDPSEDLNHLRLYIFCLLFPILLLGMITTLKYLAPFSLVADFFIVVCVIAIVYYTSRIVPDIKTVPAAKTAMGFFEFAGVVVFSMEGVGVSLPIENNMKNPKLFPYVLIAGMSVVVSFVLIVGFFGYWGYGEECQSPFTLNFPAETFPIILKALMALMIYVTYALNFWAPFNLVWHYLAKKHQPEKYWIWERIYRALIISGITIVAIALPNIGNLMGLLGAICLSNMGFIYPAIIETLVFWEDPGLGRFKWLLWKNVVIGLIGMFFFIAGTYSNMQALIISLM